MRYEIIDGEVLIFDQGAEIPFLRQPFWPDGTAWGAGEAEAWAEQVILAMTDPDADDAGDSPDAPTKPKYVPEEPEALPE
jgi:hypothetical protein